MLPAPKGLPAEGACKSIYNHFATFHRGGGPPPPTQGVQKKTCLLWLLFFVVDFGPVWAQVQVQTHPPPLPLSPSEDNIAGKVQVYVCMKTCTLKCVYPDTAKSVPRKQERGRNQVGRGAVGGKVQPFRPGPGKNQLPGITVNAQLHLGPKSKIK